jgi:hypothetical protein
VDYSQPRPVTFTAHALRALRERGLRRDDVLWVLANHDSDAPGNKPWKRELVGESGWGRIKVIVVPLVDEVRVITVHPVAPTYRRRS